LSTAVKEPSTHTTANNVAMLLVDAAAKRPDATAIIEHKTGREITFGELAKRIANVAEGLHRAGIKQGTRTVFAVKPSIEFFEGVFGLFHAGAVPIAVELKYGKSGFEKRQFALLAVMCVYGIELLADNISECRANVLEVFTEYLNLTEADDLYRAAAYVLSQNIVHGDALEMKDSTGKPITFPEWGYIGKGKFQRRDFLFDSLAQSAAFKELGN